MLKIGKFYKTIQVPDGAIRVWTNHPYHPESAISFCIPSGSLVMVVEEGAVPHMESREVDYCYYKVIYREDFLWVHPYDLVEVDEAGVPIPSKGV